MKNNLVEVVDNLQLESERLSIRRFNVTDIDVQMSHEGNPEIMRYIADIVDETTRLEKVKTFVGKWHGNEGEWLGLAVDIKGKEAAVGMVCFRFESLDFSRVEVGYRFHPSCQGQGYAIEAMTTLIHWLYNQLSARKILAYCVVENSASEKLMQKLGMKKEALLRRHSTLADIWHDELVYGMFADEFIVNC